MSVFGWLFLAIAMLYIGNVLGCLILCETIPSIRKARKYAVYVPFLIATAYFDFFTDCLREKDFFKFFKGLMMSHKNLKALKALSRLHHLDER